jgi:hypothetical protein
VDFLAFVDNLKILQRFLRIADALISQGVHQRQQEISEVEVRIELTFTDSTPSISKKSLGNTHQELAGTQDNPGI